MTTAKKLAIIGVVIGSAAFVTVKYIKPRIVRMINKEMGNVDTEIEEIITQASGGNNQDVVDIVAEPVVEEADEKQRVESIVEEVKKNNGKSLNELEAEEDEPKRVVVANKVAEKSDNVISMQSEEAKKKQAFVNQLVDTIVDEIGNAIDRENESAKDGFIPVEQNTEQYEPPASDESENKISTDIKEAETQASKQVIMEESSSEEIEKQISTDSKGVENQIPMKNSKIIRGNSADAVKNPSQFQTLVMQVCPEIQNDNEINDIPVYDRTSRRPKVDRAVRELRRTKEGVIND